MRWSFSYHLSQVATARGRVSPPVFIWPISFIPDPSACDATARAAYGPTAALPPRSPDTDADTPLRPSLLLHSRPPNVEWPIDHRDPPDAWTVDHPTSQLPCETATTAAASSVTDEDSGGGAIKDAAQPTAAQLPTRENACACSIFELPPPLPPWPAPPPPLPLQPLLPPRLLGAFMSLTHARTFRHVSHASLPHMHLYRPHRSVS